MADGERTVDALTKTIHRTNDDKSATPLHKSHLTSRENDNFNEEFQVIFNVTYSVTLYRLSILHNDISDYCVIFREFLTNCHVRNDLNVQLNKLKILTLTVL